MPKASEIVKELMHIIETDGDYEVSISCIKSDQKGEMLDEQKYLISSPTFILVEEYKDGTKEISMRDWPY